MRAGTIVSQRLIRPRLWSEQEDLPALLQHVDVMFLSGGSLELAATFFGLPSTCRCRQWAPRRIATFLCKRCCSGKSNLSSCLFRVCILCVITGSSSLAAKMQTRKSQLLRLLLLLQQRLQRYVAMRLGAHCLHLQVDGKLKNVAANSKLPPVRNITATCCNGVLEGLPAQTTTWVLSVFD